MKKKRKEKVRRYLAVFLALNILLEVISPTMAFALTSGTYQPEYLSFEPAGASEMVDLFTGDFKYNIPLMDVDGYPLNLSYHAGIGMEQEASWVGLGWGLNAGAINRVMKGIPDDFSGDVINSETYEKPRYTVGIGGEVARNSNSSLSYESMTIGTGTGFSAGVMMLYNNYKGFGIQPHFDANLSVNMGAGGLGVNFGGGVGANVSSLDGATISSHYDVGVGASFEGVGLTHNVGVGTSVNTRTGDETKSYMGSTTMSYGALSVGIGHSHTIPAGSIAHTPNFRNSYKGFGASLTAKLGFYMCAKVTIYGVTFGTEQGLYLGFNSMLNYSELSNKVNNLPAFGYMNLQNASLNSLLDFNRDKDGPFFRETPHAPMSAHTYDIFSATAQGLYHNFRPHRGDVGTVYDNSGNLLNVNVHKGTEIGVGIFAHLTLDAMTNINIGSSGKWITQLSKSQNYYQPDVTTSGDRYYEKNYFKTMGELTAHDATFSGAIGGEAAISPQVIASSGSTGDAINTFPGAAAAGPGGSIKRNNKRDIRKTNITYLSASEAEKFALEKQIIDYPINSFNLNSTSRNVDYSSTPINRTSLTGTSIDHHLSEISVTKEDGTRYFYGIPVYNLNKKKVIFNASQFIKNTNVSIPALGTSIDIGPYSTSPSLTRDSVYQLTSYTSDEISKLNRRGLDNYFHKEEIPAYAQSYLLTCIVSPDYVDLTGNGPSYDDLGEFTKFNYSKAPDNYKWRVPYGLPSAGYSSVATLDHGLLADDFDDKGYYEYGERQVWYVHSIETKNYVAEFTINNSRTDMLGVDSEDGTPATTGSDNNRYYLEKIRLFSKSEKIASANPVPIKTVNFEYDYSLCRNVFNSSASTAGKLTLKKVWFTYGSSEKSQLSPYQFSYADYDHDGIIDPSYNPDYDPKGVDRWGNVKKRDVSNTFNPGRVDNLNFDEFPYAEQRKDSADVAAAAWNLSTIYTPTGSKINIDYESDDYGYVQNKPAAQMLMLADITNSNSFTGWSPGSNNDITSAKYFVLDLERLDENGILSSVTGSSAKSLLKTKLLNNAKEMYFKCFAKLNTKDLLPGQSKKYYDYISGYAEIDYSDVDVISSAAVSTTYSRGSNTYHKYAYVAVKMDGHKDDGTGSLVNPVVKAGWQMLRTYLPKIAYPGSETNNLGTNSSNPVMILVGLLAGLNTAMFDLAAGVSDDPNYRFLTSKYCSELQFDKSWVRAFSPNKKKLGGGHRVKQIVMNDNWNAMSGENESTYGQTYQYTTTEGASTISSGVASYEPLIGGDEISLRKPLDFSVPHRFAPDDHYFMEEPLGEAFYPSGLVGYSKVTVKNIDHSYAAGDVCPIGHTSYEFYTAKDFPVKYVTSGISKVPFETDPIDDITVMATVFKSLSVADGHVLKFNDMHGKLKGVYSYSEAYPLSPISGTTYYYKKSGTSLVQTVPTINENKSVSSSIIGRDIDAVTDLRSTHNFNTGVNVSCWYNFGICEGPFFGVNLSYGSQIYDFNMAVTTKFVQQYGILDKVESFDNQSKVTTQNLLWDKNTGDVVLTQTTNNYDDPVYTFNYPAYWGYDNMGPAYKRQNITVAAPSSSIWNDADSKFVYSTVNGILKEGDEVALTNNSGTAIRCWVVYDPASSTFRLMDQDGDVVTATYIGGTSGYPYSVKVLRPIERNEFNYSAGSVTTLHNPFVATGSSTVPDLDDQVLSAAAIEYCDKWNVYCTSDEGQMADCYSTNGVTFNPYTIGLSGNWRPWKTYAYKTSRDYNTSQPDTKIDGTFTSFIPFWTTTGSPAKWVPEYSLTSLGRWVLNSENTAFSPNGNLVETKDGLGLYHSQLYGYNHTLLSAKANNAKSSQIASDGFEDYNNIYNYFSGDCSKMSMNNLQLYTLINGSGQPAISNTTAHTGRNSLYIGYSQTLSNSYQKAPISPIGYWDQLPPPCSTREMCVNKLILEVGRYVTSFWLCRYNTDADLSTLSPFGISGATINSTNKTQMINGWQKFDVFFTVSGTGTVTFTFTGPTGGIYLDDWRIQPFNSSMTAYVYDPNQLRPWAELDDRNFATIMEYDSEGTLVRTKKETERGIFTITENRKSIVKQ